MNITWGLGNAQYVKNTAMTLGSYDGVHLGHKQIIDHLLQIKEQKGCSRSLLVTFHPHPQEVLRKNNTTISLLTTIEERLELLAATGVEETLVIEFNDEFSRIPYDTFFHEILIKQLGACALVVGFNHAFGKNREGDIDHLRALALKEQVFVDEAPPLYIDGVTVSSTKIRHAITDGDMQQASHFLGRPYRLQGIVEKGDGFGKMLGYPTANIQLPGNKLLPKDGVYVAQAVFEAKKVPVALSIGTRPSVSSDGIRAVEGFLLDYSDDLYGSTLKLDVLDYIRPQESFTAHQELIAAISRDVEHVRRAIAL